MEKASKEVFEKKKFASDGFFIAIFSLLEKCTSVLLPSYRVSGIVETQNWHSASSSSFVVGTLGAPWRFQGKTVDWVSHTGMNFASVAVSVTIHSEDVKVSLLADKGNISNIDKLGDAIVKELTKS